MNPRNRHPTPHRCLALAFVTAAAFAGTAAANAQATAEGFEGFDFFENRIRPALSKYCYECHSATAKKVGGGLKLDRKEDLHKGGIDGLVVIPGDPDNSLLIKAVRYDDKDLQMPPKKSGGKRLPESVIDDLVTWVASGAPFPATPADQHVEAPPHWAFTAPQNPPLPPVLNERWPATSLDRFILAKMEAAKTSPAPPADKLTLIRRASYSLTGLPPSPGEIDAFLGDNDPDAFAKVVDRLLESPHYGEHWGRHWLDVARYADTAGDTADYPLPEAWRYRNYVIDSFNADKPYDLFLKEQLAGDILATRQPSGRYAEQTTATGYLALSRRFGFDSEHYQHLTIQDSIDTMGQGMMALTVGCARCHDHKFDPVSARDYYSLYGIFASTRYAFPGSEQKNRFRSVVPLVPREESRQRWREMQAGFATLGTTPEAVLRSLDEMDGDFEMQRFASGGSYGVPVEPWHFNGPVAITQAAQSPFKHLHPFGAVGVGIPAGAAHALFQALHPVTREGRLFFNLEFRLSGGDPASPGHHRLVLGPRSGTAAVEILISAAALTITGDSRPLVIPLQNPGEWQCLQLEFDLDTRSFTGTFGTPEAVQPLPQRALAATGDFGIGMLRLESDGNGSPAMDLDNVAVQSTPIAPVATTPEPAAADSLADLQSELQQLAGDDGDLEAQEIGAAPSSQGWHPGPNSEVRISSDSQSPFTSAYPPGNLGIHLPASADGTYNGFGRHLPQVWTPAQTELLHVSFDFRPHAPAASAAGTWRFHIGKSHSSPAAELGFHSEKFFLRSGDERQKVAELRPGQWHQVKLALNLAARTFTGTIGTVDGQAAFAGEFPPGWEGGIDYVFIDTGGHLPGAKPALDFDNLAISPTPHESAPATAAPPPAALQARIVELRGQIQALAAGNEQRQQQLAQQLAHGPVPMAYGVTEGTPQNAHIQVRGEPDRPGAEVPRGFIEILGKAALDPATEGSGRLELAEWLVRPDHPLTARVMANRLWQHHFGRGLVATPNDFGTRSQPPSHPELLDHLAHQLIDSQWSLKRMHRLILLSATWQQACAADGAPSDLYASFSRRRLKAEEIRDSILLVSGMLDATPGEAHPFPPPPSWSFTQHQPFSAVYDHQRRSVYLMVQRLKRHPFLALFDGADPNSPTAERGTTTVATQALFFLNDPFVHTASLEFAARLQQASPVEDEQAALAYRLALGRQATAAELAHATEFLAAYRDEMVASGVADPGPAALAAFLRTLFASNEFLHCD